MPGTSILMYDAVAAGGVPPTPMAVAGYVDGRWRSYDALRARFPRALSVSIATSPSTAAMVLDVEKGDASPEQAASWVRRELDAGRRRPALYLALAQLDEVLHALQAAKLNRSSIRLWTAHWTGHAHLCGPGCGQWPAGCERPGATQYLPTDAYDVSFTTPGWIRAVQHDFSLRRPT